MVAYTEEQSEDLAYGAMKAILEQDECDIAQDFDVGWARIMRRDGHGKAAPYATAPSARDGARTTFQHFDETHHLTLPRLKKAHRAMLANIPKRFIADAWSLETTTAYAPGEDSVAENTHEYARAVATGKIRNPKLFFFHRQASETHDLATVKGLRAAALEATGPSAWMRKQVPGILRQFDDPTADRSYLERVWFNMPKRSADAAFDAVRWASLAQPGYMPEPGALITLGFDGSKSDDATALIGTEVATGFQWPLGIWERPFGKDGEGWSVPEDEVDAKVAFAYETFDVWAMYADPPYWETWVNTWAGRYGEASEGKRGVVKWHTRWWRKMAEAVRAYANAMKDGALSHSGDQVFAQHIANAHRRPLDMRDEDHKPLYVIQKERPKSPRKMDAAVAGVLSWRARLDALGAGAGQEPPAWDGTIVALA
jgi:phage terminase large subunit-like protein